MLLFGDLLAPLIASIVIAYVLDGVVGLLEQGKIPRFLALLLVFLGFIALLILILFGLIPKLSQQLTQFFRELPGMITQGQSLLMQLPDKYPSLAQIFTEAQMTEMIDSLRSQLICRGPKYPQPAAGIRCGPDHNRCLPDHRTPCWCSFFSRTRARS